MSKAARRAMETGFWKHCEDKLSQKTYKGHFKSHYLLGTKEVMKDYFFLLSI